MECVERLYHALASHIAVPVRRCGAGTFRLWLSQLHRGLGGVVNGGGGIPEAGAAIAGIMTKKLSRFAPQNVCAEVKSRVVARLKAFYERFRNLGAD